MRDLRTGSRALGAGPPPPRALNPADTTPSTPPRFSVDANGTVTDLEAPGEILFHGTDVNSAVGFLNGAQLDRAVAQSEKIDGPVGFFLATDASDASFFAARRNGAVISFNLTESATEQLTAAGADLRAIPGRPPPHFSGDEFFIPPEAFDLFNELLDSGAIRVTAT